MLLEAGYGAERFAYEGRILVTEPRRIAAAGCARRILEEVKQNDGKYAKTFGYAVRGENLNPQAQCLFVTEGVLLEMLQRDFMLKDVSVIVLDEVHERSQAMDVIVGLVSKLCALRRKMFDSELKKVQ